MSATDNSLPNLHKVKKTIPLKTKVTTTTTITTTTTTTTTTKYAKSKCTKWLPIPDEEADSYDVEVVRKCTACADAGRKSYKHPFVVHGNDVADYICFECSEDVDVAFVCMTCRALRQVKNRCR
jgi:hypothetical protein